VNQTLSAMFKASLNMIFSLDTYPKVLSSHDHNLNPRTSSLLLQFLLSLYHFFPGNYRLPSNPQSSKYTTSVTATNTPYMFVSHISYSDSQYGGKMESGKNSRQTEKTTGWMIMVAGRVKKCFSSNCADWLWGITSLLCNGYETQNDWGMKLTTHLHLVPRLRTSAEYF
jgi:hypothetical protein